MEKKIITISREFGSGGRTVGHTLIFFYSFWNSYYA